MIKIRHRDRLFKRRERRKKKDKGERLREWLEWWEVSF